MNDVQQPLHLIDQNRLAAIVRAATGRAALELTEWSVEQIQRGAGEGLGVYQLSGNGHARGEMFPWSLILKVLAPSTSGDPAAWNYGPREVLAYQSGLLDELSDGLAAPRCFGIEEQADGTRWLWLEAIQETKPVWTPADYGRVARRLGRFNGIYMAERPLPDYPWLSRRWLRSFVEASAPAVSQLKQSLDHPWVRRLYPPDVAEAILRNWEERELFLAALERLSSTLCHLDAFRRNLFNRRRPDGEDETILIDWAFVGLAAVGEELTPLINASIYFLEVELDQAQTLEEEVFAGYLAGLADAGYPVDSRQVRLGYTAASALRYAIGVMRLSMPILLDTSQLVRWEQLFNRPATELTEYWAECFRRLDIRHAAEARSLLGL